MQLNQYIRNLIIESLPQAEKLYFKTGKLTPEYKEAILKITGGDMYTKLIADWVMYQLYFKIDKTEFDPHILTMCQMIYNWAKNYNKNLFPIDGNILDYNYQTNERGKHVIDLAEMLHAREDLIRVYQKLPSIAIRNLKDLRIPPAKSQFEFKILEKKIIELLQNLKGLPNGNNERSIAKKEVLLNKIFNSKNNLDMAIKVSEHFSNAFIVNDDKFSPQRVLQMSKHFNCEVIQKSKNVIVIKINDSEAMEKLGCVSNWCFSRPNSENYWDDYATLGFVYLIFNFTVDPDEASSLMIRLPDTGAVYAATNVPIEELGINDSYEYLQKIGVNLSLLRDTPNDLKHVAEVRNFIRQLIQNR